MRRGSPHRLSGTPGEQESARPVDRGFTERLERRDLERLAIFARHRTLGC
jgi:hypothetical protein